MTKAQELFSMHSEVLWQDAAQSLYERYETLNAEDIDELIDIVINDDIHEADNNINIFLYLALFSYGCGDKLPQKVYDYLLKHAIYYRSEIFLRASERVAPRLIEVLEHDDDKSEDDVNVLISCIAAIPCETTAKFLIKSSQAPPPKWAENLFMLPIEYTYGAGWETDENGEIKKLYSKAITVYEKCDKSDPLNSIKVLHEKCGYCGEPLTLIFDGEFKLATCLSCVTFETIWLKQIDSQVFWHEENKSQGFFATHERKFFAGALTAASFASGMPKIYMLDKASDKDIIYYFDYGIKVTNKKREATHTAVSFENFSHTQTGGMLVNAWYYPKCIECEESMKFVAQFDLADIDFEDDMVDFFACDKCGVVASICKQD
jgi:hypothetical protein